MPYILHVDGRIVPVKPRGEVFTLEELQGFVGGYIELGQTDDGGTMLVLNEEGKLQGLPLNVAATLLYRHRSEDYIVGDVLLTEVQYLKDKEEEE